MNVTDQALKALGTCSDPRQRVDLWLKLLVAQRETDVDAAYQAATAADHELQDLARHGRPYIRGAVELGYWRSKLLMQQERNTEALAELLRALPLSMALDISNEADYWLDLFGGTPATPTVQYPDGADQFITTTIGRGHILNIIGVVLGLLGSHGEALTFYVQAEQLAQTSNDVELLTMVENNIGYSYVELRRIDEAAPYLDRGLSAMRHLPPTLALQRLHGNLLLNRARVSTTHQQFAQARVQLDVALALNRNINWPQGEAEVLNELARLQLRSGAYDQAIEYTNQAIAVAEQHRFMGELSLSLLIRSEVEFARAQYAQAASHAHNAIQIAQQYAQTQSEADGHLLLVDIYEAQHAYADALAHHKQYHVLRDTIFSQHTNERLTTLKVLHQVEHAQRDAELYRLRAVVLEQEVDEHRRTRADLEQQALTDPLTGLWNRRQFIRLAQHIIRPNHIVAVAIFDIDHFKRVNDTWGHLVGDAVLQRVANITRQCLREDDVVCRYGGEEFAVMLPATDVASATRVLERLRRAVADTVFTTDAGRIRITISVGVAQAHGAHGVTVERFLADADRALYAAKHAGRNRVSAALELVH